MPSMERVRFVSSGTEAAMSAVRVARASTGRDRIVKFEGCYHGHADAFLVKAGSGATTLGMPTSPGVPRASPPTRCSRATTTWRRSTRSVRDAPRVRSRRSSSSRSPATWASSRRPTGSSQACATCCDALRHAADLRRGDLRVPRGGGRRAGGVRRAAGPHLPRQDHRRRPAGRRLRRPRRPDGARRARRPGVPGGHAVGQPAGDDRGPLGAPPAVAGALSGTWRAADRALAAGLADAARDAGVPLQVNALRIAADAVLHRRSGARLRLGAHGRTPTAYAAFFRGMLNRGVYPPPSQFEAWFLSAAHDDRDIARTIAAARGAMKDVARRT